VIKEFPVSNGTLVYTLPRSKGACALINMTLDSIRPEFSVNSLFTINALLAFVVCFISRYIMPFVPPFLIKTFSTISTVPL
jgi:hypothetical protein